MGLDLFICNCCGEPCCKWTMLEFIENYNDELVFCNDCYDRLIDEGDITFKYNEEKDKIYTIARPFKIAVVKFQNIQLQKKVLNKVSKL